MKTLAATYKGDRTVELREDVELLKGLDVFVVVPEPEDEATLRRELARDAERAFARLWDNEEDEVWSEYL